MKTPYTNPPSNCDLCGCAIKKVFYDFSVPGDGRWGNGCHSCFRARGGKLGIGRGQKYRKEEDGNFWQPGDYTNRAQPVGHRMAVGAVLAFKVETNITGADPRNQNDRAKLRELGMTEEEIDGLPLPAPPLDEVEDDCLGEWTP